jgi:hypothetical protein
MKTHFRFIPLATLASIFAAGLPLRAVESTVPLTGSPVQQLVNALKAANQDVIAIEVHARRPGSDAQILIAGTDDTVGRKDTDFELRMTAKDVTSIATEKVAGRSAVLVRMPLHDRAGKVIGLGTVAFKPTSGIDNLMLHVRALEIEAELSQQLSAAAAL